MGDNQQIGFGIIGTGVIAGFHAAAIADIPGAKLVGAYNRTFSKTQKFAQQFGCKAYESLDELLADPDIQIVNICTASGAHLEPAIAALKAGKHCLIEKPLEISVERCDRIIQTAKETNRKVGVIFPNRFYENLRSVKEALDGERFGNLVLGDAYVKWYRSEEYYASAPWRGTKKLDGGGALMNQGIHSMDLLQWYMGPVKSVRALKANRKHKTIEVEDTVVAMFEFKNGALGTIECTTATYPGSKSRIEIRGTAGNVVIEDKDILEWDFLEKIDSDKNKISDRSQANVDGGASDPKSISTLGHQRQIENMIEAVRLNKNPFVDGEEGKKSVAIIEAIYKSAETGEKVLISSE